MYLNIFLAGAALLRVVTAAQQVETGYSSSDTTVAPPNKDGKYWLHGNGISAALIPYGASISEIIVADQYGIQRDVVGGFDNASYYSIDSQHPHFGGVPGRYANRIKNSTFAINGVSYKILANENPTPGHPEGIDTLHGGPDGWDWRNFTVASYSNTSITFSLQDEDGSQGFPGDVVSYITYTIGDASLDFKMVAISTTKKTPIMLSSHTYWNLDGFANNQTNTVLNHTFYLPYSGQRVGVDSILVPTGEILANPPGSVNDFWTAPKPVGANFSSPELAGNCGSGCTGYGRKTRSLSSSHSTRRANPLSSLRLPHWLTPIGFPADNCWLVNREQRGSYDWRTDGFVASLHSAWSGIQLEVYSDQEAFQMYSCNGQDGSMALKKTQGLFDNSKFPRTIPKYGCVVL